MATEATINEHCIVSSQNSLILPFFDYLCITIRPRAPKKELNLVAFANHSSHNSVSISRIIWCPECFGPQDAPIYCLLDAVLFFLRRLMSARSKIDVDSTKYSRADIPSEAPNFMQAWAWCFIERQRFWMGDWKNEFGVKWYYPKSRWGEHFVRRALGILYCRRACRVSTELHRQRSGLKWIWKYTFLLNTTQEILWIQRQCPTVWHLRVDTRRGGHQLNTKISK